MMILHLVACQIGLAAWTETERFNFARAESAATRSRPAEPNCADSSSKPVSSAQTNSSAAVPACEPPCPACEHAATVVADQQPAQVRNLRRTGRVAGERRAAQRRRMRPARAPPGQLATPARRRLHRTGRRLMARGHRVRPTAHGLRPFPAHRRTRRPARLRPLTTRHGRQRR